MSDTSGFQKHKQTISWIRRASKSDIDLCYLSLFLIKKVVTLIFKVVSGGKKRDDGTYYFGQKLSEAKSN